MLGYYMHSSVEELTLFYEKHDGKLKSSLPTLAHKDVHHLDQFFLNILLKNITPVRVKKKKIRRLMHDNLDGLQTYVKLPTHEQIESILFFSISRHMPRRNYMQKAVQLSSPVQVRVGKECQQSFSM